jgi:hypothetical protein
VDAGLSGRAVLDVLLRPNQSLAHLCFGSNYLDVHFSWILCVLYTLLLYNNWIPKNPEHGVNILIALLWRFVYKFMLNLSEFILYSQERLHEIIMHSPDLRLLPFGPSGGRFIGGSFR